MQKNTFDKIQDPLMIKILSKPGTGNLSAY